MAGGCLVLLLRMGFHACDILVEPTVQVHYVGFTVNPDCFQCCSLPEARCCPLDQCSLLVNAVVGGVGVHSYSILLVVISYSLFVLGHSNLQSSLGLANVYLVAVLEGTWYTTSFFYSSGVFCFTLTSNCFRVF